MLETWRWVFNEIRNNAGDRGWWRNRLLSRVNGPIQKKLCGYDGIDVMAEDWDTLVVFDACRADFFERTWPPESVDSYRRVTSKGSWTVEWATRNFKREYGDTVYTTANPLISKHVDGKWHRLIELWNDSFDEDIGSVHPNTVTERAIQAHEEHPHKRHIIHYIQPHAPFINGERLNSIENQRDSGQRFGDSWDALRRGEVQREEIRRAYEANVEVLKEPVDALLSSIDGKIVLTADHGEVFNQYSWPLPIRVCGHPPDQRLSDLVRVPWAEISNGPRRRIIDESVKDSGENSDMSSQLEALGYV